MDVVAVTKCWYQWIHFCGVLVQRSSSTYMQALFLIQIYIKEHVLATLPVSTFTKPMG